MTFEPFAGSALLDASDLASHLRQLAAVRGQLYAVRLQIVGSTWIARQPWPSAVLRRPLWALTGGRAAALYALGDADLVILCNNLPVDQVDEAVHRMTSLFDNGEAGSGTPGLRVKWYDLVRKDDFEALVAAVAGSGSGRRVVHSPLPSVAISDLPTIVERLKRVSIGKIIRRQSVVAVHSATKMLPLFREIYASIGESQRLFASGVDTSAHPALRDYLKERFDNAILAHLGTGDGAAIVNGPFSVNVSIASVLSPEFVPFEDAFGRRHDVLLELQLDDVLDDVEAYVAVRDRLRKSGFRVVLDGVKAASLLHLDLMGLDPDLVKVNCPRRTDRDVSRGWGAMLDRSLKRIGRDRVIFAHIETEDCLKCAIGAGITRLQGPFVQKVFKALASKGLLADA